MERRKMINLRDQFWQFRGSFIPKTDSLSILRLYSTELIKETRTKLGWSQILNYLNIVIT